MSSTDLSPLTYFFMIAGPTTAAILSFVFSIWYQNRKQRREDQRSLFRTLMVYRIPDTPPLELVHALNLLDVTFANRRRVIELWRNYYNLISQEPVNWFLAYYAYLDLLAEIARTLGYKHLTQTDIAKAYSPKGQAEVSRLNSETQYELLRVLKNTAQLLVEKRTDELPSSSEPPPSH
jgi:hypothetical protein